MHPGSRSPLTSVQNCILCKVCVEDQKSPPIILVGNKIIVTSYEDLPHAQQETQFGIEY
jgi:hypothetical protein